MSLIVTNRGYFKERCQNGGESLLSQEWGGYKLGTYFTFKLSVETDITWLTGNLLLKINSTCSEPCKSGQATKFEQSVRSSDCSETYSIYHTVNIYKAATTATIPGFAILLPRKAVLVML